MAKKTILTIAVIGVIILLIGGGIYAFMSFGQAGNVEDTEETSDDGFVSIVAEFFNDAGQQDSGGVAQALIGGTNQRTGVIFQIKATNTGNTPLLNVRPVTPNTNMNGALDNIVALANLPVGATNTLIGTSGQACTPPSNASCNSNEYCSISAGNKCAIELNDYASGTAQNNVDFIVSLTADYKDEQGATQATTSSPVTITYDVRAETCSDGTTINTCKFARTGIDGDKPEYCNFVEGTGASIINKASICGCSIGEERDGVTENCIVSKCADGTNINTCSVVPTSHEGTYGAFYFCKSDKTYEARCQQCGATTDFYGNAKTSCNPATSGVLSHAVYATYTGGLSGSVTE